MSHLPRAVYSDADIATQLWLLQANGVSVPSLGQTKSGSRSIESLVKISIQKHVGAFGHPYHVISPHSYVQLVCIQAIGWNESGLM